jgi:DNA-binding MarR family transcriptional regulator
MTEPRWLTDQEQCAWRSFIDGFRTLVEVLDRQLQLDSNLSHAYFEVLVPLSEEPCHALRMSELADRARSSRSRLSHAVSRLEERGWVERLDCATDKRGQLAKLTAAGFAVVQAAAPGHVAAVRRCLIDRLTPEQLAVMGEISKIMLASPQAVDGQPRSS